MEQESVTKEPLVSVVMPAYNSERFIAEAIESVQAQTWKNWELVVMDDVSSDHTVDIVRSFAEKDPRIRLFENGNNLGAAGSRNRAFKLCHGDYVALLDSDDAWMPEKLERQVRTAESTGAEIIYCSYAMIDENDQSLWKNFVVPEKITFEEALSRSVMCPSATLLSREITDNYRFSEALYHEDLLYWLILLRDGKKVAGIRDVLASYRIRQGSRSSNKAKSALNRWRVFRYLDVPFGKSVQAFIQYAWLAVLKYKKK